MQLDRDIPGSKFISDHRSILRANILAQILVLLLGATILDGGRFGMVILIMVIAYWIGVVFIAIRRCDHVAASDILYMKWAFPALMFLAIVSESIKHA